MDSVKNVIQLRQILAERFPHLRQCLDPVSSRDCYRTGFLTLDQILGGGLLKGSMTELVNARIGSGSGLIVLQMLRQAQARNHWIGLIDGQDSFDPQPASAEILSRLCWIRCRDAAQACKATDLLLRDDNLPVLLLDLALNPAPQLKKIPAHTWYRLQRLVKQTSAAVMVITPFVMVSSADAQVRVRGQFSLQDLDQDPQVLLERLHVELVRTRFQPNFALEGVRAASA